MLKIGSFLLMMLTCIAVPTVFFRTLIGFLVAGAVLF